MFDPHLRAKISWNVWCVWTAGAGEKATTCAVSNNTGTVYNADVLV
jgi:hypothetical protein